MGKIGVTCSSRLTDGGHNIIFAVCSFPITHMCICFQPLPTLAASFVILERGRSGLRVAHSKLAASLVADGELVNDIKVADHHTELAEGDLAVKVRVRLDNRPVNQLLQLSVVQIRTDHHLEDLEELAIGDETVIVDVVDLEREPKLVFLAGART